MCGHTAAQCSEGVGADTFIEQFADEYGKEGNSDYPVVCLYNNGSFLDDSEMPPNARAGILGILALNPRVKKVVLETRADTVTQEKLEEIRRLLPGKRIEIAMGLETVDDAVRELTIHKGLSLARFKQSADIVSSLMDLRVYVLLKPPFLSEGEAIDSAVEAVTYAASLHSAIDIECCTIQDYTVVDYLARRGLYRPPWLWSIVEVLRRTEPIPVYVTPFRYIPLPRDVPHNCDLCNESVSYSILESYNRTFDRQALNGLDCSCRAKWERTMRQEEALDDLPRRVLGMLQDFTPGT